FFSSRRRHTRFSRDWSSDVCSSDLGTVEAGIVRFDSIDALRAAPEGSLAGKIAFIDQHMERTRDGSGYGKAGAVRRHGPSEAIRSEERRVGKEWRTRRTARSAKHTG